MFKNLLIGTALALVAASTSLSPAIAKSVPLRYSDPCKTAFENFNQAKWEKAHRTDQGNAGGAAGWDELADAAEQNAKTQRARAEERRENAQRSKPSPSQSDFWNKRGQADADFWNKQADEADAEAEDWEKRAKEHRAQADKMRDEAKDYEEAARKALAECWMLLTAGTVHALPGYRDITINGKPLGETGKHTIESVEAEKKPGKKIVRKAETGGGKIKKPKPTHVKKPGKATQTAAQHIARDIAVSIASQLILGEISGMGHKHKKHHKLERRQMIEGMAMEEFQPRRKMKIRKLKGVGLGMF
jgi:hypothetical protein